MRHCEGYRSKLVETLTVCQGRHRCKTSKTGVVPQFCNAMLWWSYSRVQKSIENLGFRSKMAIFRRAGMKEGGLPLPLAFQDLILMV